MQIIPVIDLKRGIAVHARMGDRDNYQPLLSRFADTSEPRRLVAGMLEALPVNAIYVADLDALTGAGANTQAVCNLAEEFSQVRFIIDRGLDAQTPIDELLSHANVDLAIASESLADLQAYTDVCARIPDTRALLSLDRRGPTLLGPSALFTRAELWPKRIIHMNLALVGADAGPDWQGLSALIARAAQHQVYAAGGVRHANDLQQLASLGVAAVLIGTALHDGRIDVAELPNSVT